MSLFLSNRFLMVYSAIVTVAFAVTVFTGFSRQSASLRIKELTVERINVVEPDGTPRMIISDQHDFPGLIIKGHDFPRNRRTAGLLFFDNEGSENGGLIFGGSKGEDGKPNSYGHLSFDKYMQTQTLVIEAQQHDGSYSKGLSILDQPDYPITDEFPLRAEIDASPGKRAELIKAFCAAHACAKERLDLGESPDKAVYLVLKDRRGRKRLVLAVQPDGTPVLRFFDAQGRIIQQIPGAGNPGRQRTRALPLAGQFGGSLRPRKSATASSICSRVALWDSQWSSCGRLMSCTDFPARSKALAISSLCEYGTTVSSRPWINRTGTVTAST